MKFKTVLTLGILAAGAAYYVYKQNEKKEEANDEKHVVDLNEDDNKVLHEIDNTDDEIESVEVSDVDEIKKLYPYLDEEFISVIYNQRNLIAHDFPSGHRANIYHEIHFDHVDELYEFVDIVMEHGYVVSCDEAIGSCKIAKEAVLNDGTVISDIFNIANQASLIHGEYVGYSVDIID